MVNALQEEDRPQRWSTKNKAVATTTRETRGSAKAVAGGLSKQDPKTTPKPGGSGRGRKQKTVVAAKGNKSSKSMPVATVNVLLGRGKNPVPSVEELRKKNEEDAAACGRTVRKVIHPATRKTCPTTTSIGTNQTKIDEGRTPIASEGTRIPVMIPQVTISPGMKLL